MLKIVVFRICWYSCLYRVCDIEYWSLSNSHTHTYANTYTLVHTLIHIHARARALTQTHTHAHTYTQTHTKAHTLKHALWHRYSWWLVQCPWNATKQQQHQKSEKTLKRKKFSENSCSPYFGHHNNKFRFTTTTTNYLSSWK